MKIRQFHPTRDSYLRSVCGANDVTVQADLAIVEFDDLGVAWDIAQLDDAVRLIEEAGRSTPTGVLVLPVVHGWQQDADIDRRDGNLRTFLDSIAGIAREQRTLGDRGAQRVIGVYLSWHGRTSGLPIVREATFWSRRLAAERVAGPGMREALVRIMLAARHNPHSKCVVVGHSMGGLIVGRALAPVFETFLVSRTAGGAPLLADLVILANPALDALASWQFIDYLRRAKAQVELRTPDGERFPAPGPFVVSVTSEADAATSMAYPFGRRLSSLLLRFRGKGADGRPGQRHLLTHTEGHVDYLVSHRARLVDGEVRIEPVPDRFNTTPFWIVRTSAEICADHSDLANPRFRELIAKLRGLNRADELGVRTWLAARSEA